MRQPLVAGNWKMNGSRASVVGLLDGILAGAGQAKNVEVFVCPPFVYLNEVIARLRGSAIKTAAQDASERQPGAFTGDVAAAMLKDIGCSGVILGHSERRTYHGESDALVASKMVVAQQAGLMPIVCVGETLEERERGETDIVVARQLDALMDSEDGMVALAQSVIAYEPVWAIGTGKTATPQQAQEVHHFIRTRLGSRDANLAARMRIVYGGSMKADNASALLAMSDIDGGLIGGASLKADDFLAICRAAQATVR